MDVVYILIFYIFTWILLRLIKFFSRPVNSYLMNGFDEIFNNDKCSESDNCLINEL